jgi:glycosyltransferase involved in cell wall biosynthesis
MNEAGQTVCLCMIVKNEHHVLRRCLESVRPLIDQWVIVDTGSTDGTQNLVRDYFQDLPGVLAERPWKNFGHNRSESIALALDRADYLLVLDADEYLEMETGFRWPHLTYDAYDFLMDSGSITYGRIQLVRSALPWRYEGVLHEYITCDRNHSQARMFGIKTMRLLEGARSRDPLTYHRDALMLEEALLLEPENTRHMFYLAQSYRDAHEPELAIDRYQRRAGMGGFAEEVWFSLYEIARLQQGMGQDWPVVMKAYLQAFAFRPTRAEPLYRIGLYYQHRKEYALARHFLGWAMQIPFPAQDVLFLESDIYRYLLPLEYAVACYWLGRHQEAIEITDRLLADGALSADRREHLLRNRQFSLDVLNVKGFAAHSDPG